MPTRATHTQALAVILPPGNADPAMQQLTHTGQTSVADRVDLLVKLRKQVELVKNPNNLSRLCELAKRLAADEVVQNNSARQDDLTPTSMVHVAAARYIAVAPAVVREGFETESKECGKLENGEEIDVLESRLNHQTKQGVSTL